MYTFKNHFSICVNNNNWIISENCNIEISHSFKANNSIIIIKFIDDNGKVEKYNKFFISGKEASYTEEQNRAIEIEKYIKAVFRKHYIGTAKDFILLPKVDFDNEVLTVSFINKELNEEDFCFSSYSTVYKV